MSEKMAVKKEILIEAPLERAFRVFTASMGSWWPKEHHLGKSPLVDVVVEPKAGGRWHEVTEDGAICDWGKVLAWDPPKRVVLAWQLNDKFEYDATFMTEIEVRFDAVDARKTMVRFEHRDLERYGASAAKVFESLTRGWADIIDSYNKSAIAA
jgi:uncharacterized protein YndB with AHSA1/START domain